DRNFTFGRHLEIRSQRVEDAYQLLRGQHTGSSAPDIDRIYREGGKDAILREGLDLLAQSVDIGSTQISRGVDVNHVVTEVAFRVAKGNVDIDDSTVLGEKLLRLEMAVFERIGMDVAPDIFLLKHFSLSLAWVPCHTERKWVTCDGMAVG